MTRSATPANRGSGRPTSAEAARLERDIKEAALRLFLARGYEGTSVEDVAVSAGTTKQSLYARFRGKEELFSAVLNWAIERPDWPSPQTAEDVSTSDLETALLAVAENVVRRVLDPEMVALSRLVIAQADRFPEIAHKAYRIWPRQKAVASLLREHAAAGTIRADDPDQLAELFLGMVAMAPARMASFGILHDAETRDRRTHDAVQLFLSAIRRPDPRSAAAGQNG
ncbi:TetR/AcrR family transcriptional regulator [Pseudofrankia inefficax]|uniref:Regulatory protein TetR n=1 Tax=Pseudofrankia inefficax (strain DSM 45817 / CECT 9037 / DDB 130130 / EuI1c) TaxID=298654 RepID=E3J9G6_PSEI1|nr:TetR/AcrR family transcriptional regulator [Pseudofrankia inefficax]ADP83330.1 regulatory protein TetR [Pseudofrankia inefficax]